MGLFGNIEDGHMKVFQKLLHLDVFRGPHSTGILVVDEEVEDERSYYLYKALGAPENLYNKYNTDFSNEGVFIPNKEQKVCLLMGHNRWATQGEINEDNAHPFEFDNVIGAHNGTIDQWGLSKLDGKHLFDVDSQVLFHHLSNNSLQDLWYKAWGAMALSYWDFRDDTFNLIRNNERPLFVGRIGQDVIVYASERWMLEVVNNYSRHNITDIKPLPINTHLQMSWKDGKLSVNSHTIKEYEYSSNLLHPASKEATKKGWLKITDFVPFGHGSSKKHGYFVAEELYSKENRTFRVTLWGLDNTQKEEMYDLIMKRGNEGKVFYTFSDSFIYGSGSHMSPSICLDDLTWQSQVSLAKPKKSTEQAIFRLDSEGNKIDYFDWCEVVEDGCMSCYSPIPAADWQNKTNLYYFDPTSKICLCPLCNTAENRHILKDYVEV